MLSFFCIALSQSIYFHFIKTFIFSYQGIKKCLFRNPYIFRKNMYDYLEKFIFEILSGIKKDISFTSYEELII